MGVGIVQLIVLVAVIVPIIVLVAIFASSKKKK